MPIIVSDNIERECANLISIYKDATYLAELLPKYRRNLSGETIKNVSNDIQSYISQAFAFLNETDDRIMTAPLTMYYSACNFAKAIYYIHYPHMTLKGSHGLSLDNKTAENIKELALAAVETHDNGAFGGLICVTGDQLASGKHFTCKDLFSIIPELCGMYALRYSEEPNVYLMKGYKSKEYCYDLLFQTDGFSNKMGERFSLPAAKGMHLNTTSVGCTLLLSQMCSEEYFNDTTYVDVHGNRYLTSGLFDGTQYFKMSKIVALYLLYYTFSMLARYYPEEWLRLCEGADSAIIKKVVVDLRREMLVEVLRYLSDKEYIFETKLPSSETELDIHDLWRQLKKEEEREKMRSGRY